MTLCGRDKTLPIMSNGPILVIEFLGFYSSTHNTGFKLSYEFVQSNCFLIYYEKCVFFFFCLNFIYFNLLTWNFFFLSFLLIKNCTPLVDTRYNPCKNLLTKNTFPTFIIKIKIFYCIYVVIVIHVQEIRVVKLKRRWRDIFNLLPYSKQLQFSCVYLLQVIWNITCSKYTIHLEKIIKTYKEKLNVKFKQINSFYTL